MIRYSYLHDICYFFFFFLGGGGVRLIRNIAKYAPSNAYFDLVAFFQIGINHADVLFMQLTGGIVWH